MNLHIAFNICRKMVRANISFRCFVVSIAVLLSILAVPSVSQAMMVSPVLIDVTADPGQVIEKTISIKNESSSVSRYSFMTENFSASGESGAQSYSGDDSTDLASWISWSTSTVSVKSNEAISVPIRITIPRDAGAGGHYATVFISRSDVNEKDSVGLNEQIGVLFLVRVSGEVVDLASVESFRLKAEHSTLSRLPAAFELRIRNKGGSHIRPEGSVVVKNALGKIVSVLPINRNGGAILPRSVRKFDLNWGDEKPSCDKSFWLAVRNEFAHFAFGYYTADLHVTYGEQHQSLDRTSISFWVIPWHLFIVCFGALILAVVAYKAFKHCLICRLVAEAESRRGVKRPSSSRKKM